MTQTLTEAENNNDNLKPLLEECVNIIYSLRMLSLNVVKCVIQWRKQMIFNFMTTLQYRPNSAAN